MAYNITLSNGTDLITGGLLDNTTDSANSSLTLVGKNFKGYGLFLNQNFVRLMENFALGSAPSAPLPGQLWFNSTTKLLNLNVASVKGTASAIWKTVAGLTLSSTTPTDSYTGELWYDSVDGQLKIYTGTAWRIIGPAGTLATGNSGAIPDIVTDAPPSTTFVVIKFFVDNVLVGIWSKDAPFVSDIPGFATIRRGLNLSTAISQAFWGNVEAASNLLVSGIQIPAANFVRNDTSGTVNGALSLVNDGGLTVGAANDFVASVSGGVVTLRNQTNNRDLILSLRTGGVQTPFLRGNANTGLAEAYANPIGSSPALTVATKNYVDILAGAVTGTANFFGNLTPSSNVFYTLGNTTNRWSNIFTENILVGNIAAANLAATTANIAQIFIGADIIPTANLSSNIGSSGLRFSTLHSRDVSVTGSATVGTSLAVGGNVAITGSTTALGNYNTSGNLVSTATTNSTSTTTGALIVAGGAGIAGNLNVGGVITAPTLPLSTANTAVATTAFVQTISMPAGSVIMWPTVSAPTGYLLCNGTAVSRTTYAALFAVIGTTFGSGDGSTTFNLPNYVNRGPVGAGGLYAMGTTGGSKDAVVVSHTHTATVTDPGHSHQTGSTSVEQGFFQSGIRTTGTTGSATSTSFANISVGIGSTGSSGTDANMQPYFAINFVIKF